MCFVLILLGQFKQFLTFLWTAVLVECKPAMSAEKCIHMFEECAETSQDAHTSNLLNPLVNLPHVMRQQ
jgi:hypothetical protein